MSISAVFTDLDGTLLELDGLICQEAQLVLRRLIGLGIPVCALTSKTVAELVPLLRELGLDSPSVFENGAGVLFPGGFTQLFDRAVPAWVLNQIAADLRTRTGAPLRTMDELTDQELSQTTRLPASQLTAVRQRLATAPLLVDEAWDEALASALPSDRDLLLIRGNRFLHLQGNHDKGTALKRLATMITRPPGPMVVCGDSPNDLSMLAAAEVRVVIPSKQGPHASLVGRFPDAVIAPYPHGRGWAAAIAALLDGGRNYE
jgi:mannosyl-3-phosphoglycerate phosphatase